MESSEKKKGNKLETGPMKILQAITSFPPAYAYGGPVQSAYHISTYLADQGHEVTVYTTDVLDSNSRLQFDENPTSMDGVKIRRFRNISNTLAYKYNIDSAPQMGIALKRHIHEFDVVHLHDLRSIQAILVSLISNVNHVPVVIQPRGTVPRESKYLQKKTFDLAFGESIVNNATRIIASSKIESDQYSEVFPNIDNRKIVHVQNGIDPKEYQDLPPQGQFRSEYSIDPDKFIILFLSRIHKRKGLDILVEAFHRLKNEVNMVKLVIAGPDDGYLRQTKALVNEMGVDSDVIFTGPLFEEDKLSAYTDANVFVLPSKNRYESFGNVVIEALACEVPVVLTNVCGVSEWVDQSSCNIVKPKADDLYRGIKSVIETPPSISQKNIFNKFSWTIITEKLEKIYKESVRKDLA